MVDVVDLSYSSEAEIFILFKGFEGQNHPSFI
jgi:hypothetical protein